MGRRNFWPWIEKYNIITIQHISSNLLRPPSVALNLLENTLGLYGARVSYMCGACPRNPKTFVAVLCVFWFVSSTFFEGNWQLIHRSVCSYLRRGLAFAFAFAFGLLPFAFAFAFAFGLWPLFLPLPLPSPLPLPFAFAFVFAITFAFAGILCLCLCLCELAFCLCLWPFAFCLADLHSDRVGLNRSGQVGRVGREISCWFCCVERRAVRIH